MYGTVTIICEADVSVGNVSILTGGTMPGPNNIVITVKEGSRFNAGIIENFCGGDVKINGGGVLQAALIDCDEGQHAEVLIDGIVTVYVENAGDAILASDIKISGNAVVFAKGATGIKSRGPVAISNQARVYAEGTQSAIEAGGDVSITGSPAVYATGTGVNSNGIFSRNGDISVNISTRVNAVATGTGTALLLHRGTFNLTAGTVWVFDDLQGRLLVGNRDLGVSTYYMTSVVFPPLQSTEGWLGVTPVSPDHMYTQLSDREYEVPVDGAFAFRLQYDYDHADNSTEVTANGVRIYPDRHGVYTVVCDGNDAVQMTIHSKRYNVPGLPIMREVLFRTGEGVIADVPDGIHYVRSLEDFAFIAEATIPGTEIAVETAYSVPDGLVITPLGNWRWQVRLRGIQQNIDVTVKAVCYEKEVGQHSSVATAASVGVRASGGILYVTAATNGSAQIYNVAGQLVKTLPHPAGETVQTVLPKGFYLVRAAGKTSKIRIH